MRVLHVLPTLTGGGAEAFVAALLPSLADEGVHCGVMTIYPSEIPFDLHGRDIDILEVKRRGRYDAGFLPRMIARMRAWEPDIVHTHMHNGKYWGRLAALLAKTPAIVHTVHNPCDVKRLIGASVADRLLNAASAAIVTFLDEQRRFLCEFERIPLEKVEVIPNGIRHMPAPEVYSREAARARLGSNNREFEIFVVGTLYGPKNQRLAIEALAAMPPGLRALARMRIVGDGVDRPRLEELTRKLDLSQNVTFLGRRSDVREILPAADLLFMPSLTEGMPLALLEAMSAGVPVLSTPWIGARDLLEAGELGTLTPNWSSDSVAGCLVQSMRDATRGRALAARAQARVRDKYDIKTTAKAHFALYRNLIEERCVA